MVSVRPILRDLAVALVATALSLPLRRYVLVQLLGLNTPFLACILVVVGAAWYAGLRAGLLTTLLTSSTIAIVAVGRPVATGNPETFITRFVIFIIVALFATRLIAAWQAERRRVERRQRQLEHEIAERRVAESAERAHREQLLVEIERRQSVERELSEREERIRLAVESAEIGTWDFNPLTDEHTWSTRSKSIFGLASHHDENAIPFYDRVHPEDRLRVENAIDQALDPQGDGRCEIDYRVVWPDDSVHWVVTTGRAQFEGEGDTRRAIRFLGTARDITDRKQAVEALRASENRLQAIMDNTPAVVYLKDAAGRYLMINRRFEALFHVDQKTVAGKTDADLFPPNIVAQLQANDQRVRDSGQPVECEEVVPQQDGLHTYVSVKFPIYDAKRQSLAVCGISTDISELRRTADTLKEEQEFLQHTIEVQEQERQLIAYEIHDGLVQYATGALLQLEALQLQAETAGMAAQIEAVTTVLRRAVAEGRHLMNGIRSPVLDDWGIIPAIEQLIEEEDRAHVRLEFVKDEQLGRLAPAIEDALYRITQEALTNVRKHSQSLRVRVELQRYGLRVQLIVEDWGIGFQIPSGTHNIHGLKSMANRARVAGGTCTVDSRPGQGTKVVVDLPYVSRLEALPPAHASSTASIEPRE